MKMCLLALLALKRIALASALLIALLLTLAYPSLASERRALSALALSAANAGKASILLACFQPAISAAPERAAHLASLHLYEQFSATPLLNSSNHRLAGQEYCLLGDYQKALASFKRARQLARGDVVSSCELLALYERLGDDRAFNQLLADGFIPPGSLAQAASVLIDMGRLEDALTWSQAAIQANPTEMEAWVNLVGVAVGYEKRKDWNLAAVVASDGLALQDQLALNVYRGSFYFHAGYALYQQDSPANRPQILAYYNQAIADGNFANGWDESNVYYNRAIWLRESSAHYPPERYLADYLKAYQLKPQASWIAQSLGLVYLQDVCDFPQAEYYFRRAISLSPEDAADDYYLGLALAAQADYTGALEAYRRALELKPGWKAAADRIEATRKIVEGNSP